ncbi:rCG59493, partial [Rattus norvegicus]
MDQERCLMGNLFAPSPSLRWTWSGRPAWPAVCQAARRTPASRAGLREIAAAGQASGTPPGAHR